MSAESRYRRERPWAAQVVDTHEAIRKAAVEHPDMYAQDAIPGTQFAIAFAILDLSDAIRDHGKRTR